MAFKKDRVKECQLTVRMYKEDYEDWYKLTHARHETMAEAVYALMLKEIKKNKDKLKNEQ